MVLYLRNLSLRSRSSLCLLHGAGFFPLRQFPVSRFVSSRYSFCFADSVQEGKPLVAGDRFGGVGGRPGSGEKGEGGGPVVGRGGGVEIGCVTFKFPGRFCRLFLLFLWCQRSEFQNN